jgi:hypothetical protein
LLQRGGSGALGFHRRARIFDLALETRTRRLFLLERLPQRREIALAGGGDGAFLLKCLVRPVELGAR